MDENYSFSITKPGTRQLLAVKACSFVEKVDYFKSYSQYGLTRIITIHAQG